MKKIIVAIVVAMALLLVPLTASADPGIRVTEWGGNGTWISNTWSVDLYAGESASVKLKIESSEDAVVYAEYDTSGALQIYFNPSVLEVRAGEGRWLEVTIYAPGDIKPGEYEVAFTFKAISTGTKTETKIVTEIIYRDRDVPGPGSVEYVDREVIEYVDREVVEYVDREVPKYIYVEKGIAWWWLPISIIITILAVLLCTELVRRKALKS